MSVFVILALACAVLACAAAVLAAFQVLSAGRRLAGTLDTTMTQLRPLVDELTQEAAVTAAELEAFSARGAAGALTRESPELAEAILCCAGCGGRAATAMGC